MSNKPKRLLERYEVLLEHLDFEYIRQCNDERELEKIVKILRSGEEGYFPQLTSFAEQSLQTLNPNSKVLRKETPLGTKESVPTDSWQQINLDLKQWETNITAAHERILDRKHVPLLSIPPIRNSSSNIESQKTSSVIVEKPRYCDYRSWDQYDPDTEMLKMDLSEERHRELLVQKRNDESIDRSEVDLEADTLRELSEPERETLAGKLREKGNDYFRAKEFDSALKEYSASITAFPTAACFNNRAITYIKQTRYTEAIADCDSCLKLEPNNLKALLRKGEALFSSRRNREAYQIYCRVLLLDATNAIAVKRINIIQQQIFDLPPVNAHQIIIEDVRNDANEENDYAALIKPKKITKDKLPNAIKLLEKETAKMVRNHATESQQSVEILNENSRKSKVGAKKSLIEEL
ncbi:sperm-associated antigen 1 [Wyeomyia smithii]|uniref:sperm-associated antigen 1 n=1 Tax=Wyeomyia smithii TaxID=174621 RepID=UPI0024681B2F|nr:sperm-associated antigen 1 [Wyeomyia smithii]